MDIILSGGILLRKKVFFFFLAVSRPRLSSLSFRFSPYWPEEMRIPRGVT